MDHSLIAGIRALALAVVLSGCGARSALDQTERAEVTPSCAASCEEQHPEGLRILDSYKGSCGCRTCSKDCAVSVCLNRETPSNECLPCLQEGLKTRCAENDGFFAGGCSSDKKCSDLVACITACPSK